MRKKITYLFLSLLGTLANAQGPAVTSWLQNTTATGTYYPNGNSTPQGNSILVNCQAVQYSASNVYISTKGIPAYPTGPFQDGNPNQAGNQNAIFKFPLTPVQNTEHQQRLHLEILLFLSTESQVSILKTAFPGNLPPMLGQEVPQVEQATESGSAMQLFMKN